MGITLGTVTFQTPTTELPAHGNGGGRGAGELSKRIIAEVMGLKDGEYLPVLCGSPKEANKLQARRGFVLFKGFGISAKQRGNIVYFYKNGTH